jgi:S-adenosylmethionine synthetase
VTINYRNDNGRMIPLRVHTVVISTQHADNITNEFIRKELMEKIVKTTIPHGLLDKDTVRALLWLVFSVC